MNGRLATVIDSLTPGLSMDLETGYNRNTSVVIRQSLFRLDSRAPGQVDHLNLKMCKKKEVDNPKEKCIFFVCQHIVYSNVSDWQCAIKSG